MKTRPRAPTGKTDQEAVDRRHCRKRTDNGSVKAVFPRAIAQQLVYYAIAVSTAVLGHMQSQGQCPLRRC